MKFVCTGIVLVVLLASALAMPPGLQDKAGINNGLYQCFAAPNCAGFIAYVDSLYECCHIIRGMAFWNYATCTKWLVKFHA